MRYCLFWVYLYFLQGLGRSTKDMDRLIANTLIVEMGYVYIATPPLYRITAGKNIDYAWDDDTRDKIIKELKKSKHMCSNFAIQAVHFFPMRPRYLTKALVKGSNNKETKYGWQGHHPINFHSQSKRNESCH